MKFAQEIDDGIDVFGIEISRGLISEKNEQIARPGHGPRPRAVAGLRKAERDNANDLLLSVVTASGFAAQTKSKKAAKAEATSEQKKDATATKAMVDLNSASEKELDELPGIGPALAKKIIAGRPYSSVSDLSKAGVPARTIKKITPMVTVGAASAAAESKTAPAAKTPPSAAAPASQSTPSASTPEKSASKATATAPAAGGGNGKVWVNTKSGVYHREGDRWYGKTKEGKCMTEDEAIKAGYHADKEGQSKKNN